MKGLLLSVCQSLLHPAGTLSSNGGRMMLGKTSLYLAATLAIGCLVNSASLVSAASYTNPVQAGDYPDPSVIRVRQDYWATATSSDWGPPFPILHSRDLVN